MDLALVEDSLLTYMLFFVVIPGLLGLVVVSRFRPWWALPEAPPASPHRPAPSEAPTHPVQPPVSPPAAGGRPPERTGEVYRLPSRPISPEARTSSPRPAATLAPPSAPARPVPVVEADSNPLARIQELPSGSTMDHEALRREAEARGRSLQDLRRRFDLVFSEREQLKQEVAELRRTLADAQELVRSSERRLGEQKARLSAVHSELSERELEIERLQLHARAIEDLRAEVISLERERDLLRAGPGALGQEHGASLASLHEMEALLEQERAARASIEAEYMSHSEAWLRAEADARTLRERLAMAEDALLTTQSEVAASLRHQDRLAADLQAAQTRLQETARARDTAEDESLRLSAQLARTRAELEQVRAQRSAEPVTRELRPPVDRRGMPRRLETGASVELPGYATPTYTGPVEVEPPVLGEPQSEELQIDDLRGLFEAPSIPGGVKRPTPLPVSEESTEESAEDNGDGPLLRAAFGEAPSGLIEAALPPARVLPAAAPESEPLEMPGVGVVEHLEEGNTPAPLGRLLRKASGGGSGGLRPAELDGNAMAFDGTLAQRLTEDGFEGLSGPGFTVEAWIRPANDLKRCALLSYVVRRRTALGIYLEPQHGKPAVAVGIDGEYTPAAIPTDLEPGRWQHLAITWNAATGALQVLVDAEVRFVGSLAGGARIPGAGRMVVGQEASALWGDLTPGMSFVGALDEVRIWRTSRAQGEIQGDRFRRLAPSAQLVIWRA